MKLIKREDYLLQLRNVKNTPDIKVITGVRRSGKSKLLLSYIQEIKENESDANILYINLQEYENENLLTHSALHEYVMNNYDPQRNNYLFIDEVQLCANFEKAVNSLHAKELFDIYITGSNAFLLSSDLATLFTGRTFTIEVFPFSFKEYIQYFSPANLDIAFDEYQKIGGFAGSYLYNNTEDKYSYLKDEVYETITHRDIIQKYNIRNRELFTNLTNYLLDNISNLTSSRSIVKYLANDIDSSSHNTITNYIKYLCRAFVFYETKRYDLHGKKHLSTEQKYYLIDHALKYAILGTKNLDYGRSLENIVYIELLRRGYEVYIGKLYKKEIDFVAVKRNEQIYIQVSTYLEDENTLKREITPLLAIRDAYPKMIIARTHQEDYFCEGVTIKDIALWLLDK